MRQHILSPRNVLQVYDTETRDGVTNFLTERYRHFRSMQVYELVNALQFLDNCGLIEITRRTDELQSETYYTHKIVSSFPEKPPKEQLMKELQICIKYPMFYMDIVQSLLPGKSLPDILLERIVKQHVRGLLPSDGCIEYLDDSGIKVDYVKIHSHVAIEIFASNKDILQTHFDMLPDGFRNILLSENRAGVEDGIEVVPYYRFIYDNSEGKDIAYPITGIPFDKWIDSNFIITPSDYDKKSYGKPN